MKTLILFATELEANTTKQKLIHPDIEIVITGMGPVETYMKSRKWIKRADLIINIGLCGSFDVTLTAGSCHDIAEVSYLSSHLPKITLQENGEKLLTSPKPVYEKIRTSGLVDMEGYVIAHVAKQMQKPLKMFKVVSDHCNANSHTDIKQRILQLSEVLYTLLCEKL